MAGKTGKTAKSKQPFGGKKAAPFAKGGGRRKIGKTAQGRSK